MTTPALVRNQNIAYIRVLDPDQQNLGFQSWHEDRLTLVVQSQNALLRQETDSMHSAFLKYQEKMKESFKMLVEENVRIKAELVASNARYDELNTSHQTQQGASGVTLHKLKQELDEKNQHMTKLTRKISKLTQVISKEENLRQMDIVAMGQIQAQLLESTSKLKQEILTLQHRVKALKAKIPMIEELKARAIKYNDALINIEREIIRIENYDPSSANANFVKNSECFRKPMFERFTPHLKESFAKCKQFIQQVKNPDKI